MAVPQTVTEMPELSGQLLGAGGFQGSYQEQAVTAQKSACLIDQVCDEAPVFALANQRADRLSLALVT